MNLVYKVYARTSSSESWTKICQVEQALSTALVDGLLALIVQQARIDYGATSEVEVRGPLGVVLWSVTP